MQNVKTAAAWASLLDVFVKKTLNLATEAVAEAVTQVFLQEAFDAPSVFYIEVFLNLFHKMINDVLTNSVLYTLQKRALLFGGTTSINSIYSPIDGQRILQTIFDRKHHCCDFCLLE